MDTGPIFTVFDNLISKLRYLNLVELFKCAAVRITPEEAPINVRLRNLRLSVDVYIGLKWLFILLLLFSGISNPLTTLVAWYLAVANLYTYFLLHVWSRDVMTDSHMDVDRVRRRFFNLIQAIFFTLICFAYFYAMPYRSEFAWAGGQPSIIDSLWYSISNSLTSNYVQVVPISNAGVAVSMVQLLMMFAFLTIIIGGSVPQPGGTQEGSDGLQE
jgi:hypothetical protein